jgi:hypothetical protein
LGVERKIWFYVCLVSTCFRLLRSHVAALSPYFILFVCCEVMLRPYPHIPFFSFVAKSCCSPIPIFHSFRLLRNHVAALSPYSILFVCCEIMLRPYPHIPFFSFVAKSCCGPIPIFHSFRLLRNHVAALSPYSILFVCCEIMLQPYPHIPFFVTDAAAQASFFPWVSNQATRFVFVLLLCRQCA